jgi:ribonuclease VapC
MVAILRDESDALMFAESIERAAVVRISAANFLETAIVIDANRSPISSRRVDDFVIESRLRIEPVTETQARIARQAYRDFGRGSGQPAGLNFGDCFAYALAKATGEPLLYKGNDFSRTDVASALT